MPKIAALAALAFALAGAMRIPPTLILIALPPAAALALIGWRRALARRPEVYCRPCRGTGRRVGVLFAATDGRCPTCRGTGQRPRAGTRLLNIR